MAQQNNRRFRLRPQILTAIVSLAVVGVVAMFLGYNEVATATPGAIGMLAMKLLDSEEK